MVDLVHGGAGFAALGVLVVGVLAWLMATATVFSGRRIATVAFLIVPIMAVAVGHVAGVIDTRAATAAVQAAGTDSPLVAAAGVAGALGTPWVTRWGAAVLLMLSALSAGGVALLRPGEAPKWTLVTGLAAGGAAMLGGAALAVYGAFAAVGPSGFAVVALVVVGGMGPAIGALRRSEGKDAVRVSPLRISAAVCFFAATLQASYALEVGLERALHAELALGGGDSAAFEAALAAVVPGSTLAWGAVAVGALTAGLAVIEEIAVLSTVSVALDVVGSFLLLVLLGAVGLAERGQLATLTGAAQGGPVGELVRERGEALPAAGLSIDGQVVDVSPVPGGFGDVVAYSGVSWLRVSAYDGVGWNSDATPLEQAELYAERPVLVVAKANGPASSLDPALEATAAMGALLLMRSSDLPDRGFGGAAELAAAFDAAYLPLASSTGEPSRGELWMTAVDLRPHRGPIAWYGAESRAKDPATRIMGAVAATGARGVHVSVGQRDTVSDVVAACLPVVVGADLALSGAWCGVTRATEAELSAASEKGWKPARAEATVTVDEGASPVAVKIALRVAQEAAAFDDCARQARALGQDPAGLIVLQAGVSYRGEVSDLEALQMESTSSSPEAHQCVMDRVRPLDLKPQVGEDSLRFRLNVELF